ncbi:MAG: GAF domain-containing sensor histidine kinase, partial [Chloroflexota bacterium]|nr:GAF domain-containing sensor histidine kinase [Chloroflexota bacterium]
LMYSLVRLKEPDTRRGVTIIAIGTAVSILPFMGLAIVPIVLRCPEILAAEYAILPLALMPASFAYAILRHDVLRVPLLQRWLVRSIVWVGVILPYTAVVWAQYVLLEPVSEPWRSVIKAASLVLLVAVSYGWLRDRLLAVADRLIFKDAYDYRASLQALSRDLSVAGDLDTLGTWLPTTLRRLMNLEFALLLVPDRGGIQVLGADGEYRPEMVTELAVALSEVGETPAVVPLAYGYLNVLLVPLRSRGEVVGYLCLGPKATGEPFREEDRDLLATLSGQVAGVVRNAQLVDELRAKVASLDDLNERLAHAQEEERVRLSADIHDEPLQTAIALQRRLASYHGGHHEAEEHLRLSRDVVDQLRSVCASMRPPALDDLGLQDALDALAQELGERAGVTITLETDPVMAGAVLPGDVELVLYRTAQEAINNALRHAQPSCIRIRLQQEQGMVRLCVLDNGEGFSVPDSFDDLVQHGHLGLAGLRERVQRAGGELEVSSQPGKGTTVRANLPAEELRA